MRETATTRTPGTQERQERDVCVHLCRKEEEREATLSLSLRDDVLCLLFSSFCSSLHLQASDPSPSSSPSLFLPLIVIIIIIMRSDMIKGRREACIMLFLSSSSRKPSPGPSLCLHPSSGHNDDDDDRTTDDEDGEKIEERTGFVPRTVHPSSLICIMDNT